MATVGLPTVTSFLITRFGNVPINGRIEQWAATAPPADHAKILSRRELSDDAFGSAGIDASASEMTVVGPHVPGNPTPGPQAVPCDVARIAPLMI